MGLRHNKLNIPAKIIAIVILSAFLAQDFAWAYPDNFSSSQSNNKLAPASYSERYSVNDRIIASLIFLVEQNRVVPKDRLTIEAAVAILRKNQKFLDENKVRFAQKDAEILIYIGSNIILRYLDPASPAKKIAGFAIASQGKPGILIRQILVSGQDPALSSPEQLELALGEAPITSTQAPSQAPAAAASSINEPSSITAPTSANREEMAASTALGIKYLDLLRKLSGSYSRYVDARSRIKILEGQAVPYKESVELLKAREKKSRAGHEASKLLQTISSIDWRTYRIADNAPNNERLDYIALNAREMAMRLQGMIALSGPLGMMDSLKDRFSNTVIKVLNNYLNAASGQPGQRPLPGIREFSEPLVKHAEMLKAISKMARDDNGVIQDTVAKGKASLIPVNVRREMFVIGEKCDELARQSNLLDRQGALDLSDKNSGSPGSMDLGQPQTEVGKEMTDGLRISPVNPIILQYIDNNRAIELNGETIIRIRRDKSSPRDPELEAEFRSTGIFDKVRRARDSALLRRIILNRPNLMNLTPAEREDLIAKSQKLSLSIILGSSFIGFAKKDGNVVGHARAGRNKASHGLEQSMWIGADLLAIMSDEELAQFIMEETQHMVRPHKWINGRWINKHIEEAAPEDRDPAITIKHDGAFTDRLIKLASLLDNPLMNALAARREGTKRYLKAFLQRNHPLKEKVFRDIDAMSDEKVLAAVDQLFKTDESAHPHRYGAGNLALRFLGRYLSIREIYLNPCVGYMDLTQILLSQEIVTYSSREQIDSAIAYEGEEKAEARIKTLYTIIKALSVIYRTYGLVLVQKEDVDRLVKMLAENTLEGHIRTNVKNLLQISDICIPVDTSQKLESLNNLSAIIERLKSEGGLWISEFSRPENVVKLQQIYEASRIVIPPGFETPDDIEELIDPNSPKEIAVSESQAAKIVAAKKVEDPIIRVIIHNFKNKLIAMQWGELMLFDAPDKTSKDLEIVREHADLAEKMLKASVDYLNGRIGIEETINIFNDGIDDMAWITDAIKKKLDKGGYSWNKDTRSDAEHLVEESNSNILPLLRGLTGWLDRAMSAVDFESVINDSIAAMRSRNELLKDIEIEVKASEDLKKASGFLTYKLILEMAVEELITNALKHSRTDKITISGSLTGEGELKVGVGDHGIGIPPENLEKILKTPGFTTAVDGTGYGLFDLREAIESVGGEMRVENELGKGSSFSFTLPVNAPMDVVARAQLTTPIRVTVSGLKGSGRRTMSQWLAAKLGLMYINGGFLARVVLYEMLKQGKTGKCPDFNDKAAVLKFMEEFFASGRLDYSHQVLFVDGLDTTKPDSKGISLRDIIKTEIDKNPENTKILHKIFDQVPAKQSIIKYIDSVADMVKASGKYNGIVTRVTTPNPDSNNINVMLVAPSDVRALRSRTDAGVIDKLDVLTEMQDISGAFPDVMKLDMTKITREKAMQALVLVISQLPSETDKKEWFERLARAGSGEPASKNMVRKDLGTEKVGITQAIVPAAVKDSTKQALDPEAEILAGMHDLFLQNTSANVKDDAKILLSENLFIKDGNEEELDQIRIALAPLLTSGYVAIMKPDDIRKAATNRNASKDKLAVVLTEKDTGSKSWSTTEILGVVRSSILIVGDDLTGDNYLYLEGVIGLARAIMADDRSAIRKYYQIISGKTIDDNIMMFLNGASENNIFFAVNAILKFKPIARMDAQSLTDLKIRMENFLIAA
jgi:Signal transduction histidine kinase